MLKSAFDKLKTVSKIGLGGLLLTFMGCAGSGDMNLFGARDGGIRESDSLYGNYLAGRFAGSLRDARNAAAFYERVLDRDPTNASILERAFLLKVTDGRIDEASKLAAKIVDIDDGNRLGRLVLALDAFRRGEYAAARADLERSRDGPVTELVRTLITAWSYAAEGDAAAAMRVLDRAEDDPGLAGLYAANRAFINDHAGADEAAAGDYRQAMRITDGRSLSVVQAYGAFLRRTGRAGEARRVYEDYLDLSPDHAIMAAELEDLNEGIAPEPAVASARAGAAKAIYGPASYLAQERAPELPVIYLQLALHLHPDFAVARTLLADLFEFARRWDDAIRAYARIPSDSVLHRQAQVRVAVNLDRLDRTDEAVSNLRRMIRQDETDLDALTTLADILRSRDRFEEAVDVYDRAVAAADQIGDEHWSLFYARGVALERSDRWPEAERDFLKSLSLSPDQPLTLNYLGYSWVDQGVNIEEAMRLIEKAVDLRPDDGYIVDSLGWGYYKRGDYPRAVAELERAVELQPDDPVINEHLGDAYWQVGRYLEARFQWRHALSLDPLEETVPIIETKLQYGLEDSGRTDAAL